ncbi:TapY2 family type IVa secretion system protein [Ferrimonas pelagia]|uniref:Uncharacterized protein n=1 Tax=Ferrimonas pelagia TaxID=1177826 RepID=A0ABP9EC29_9GAMM
MRWIVVWFLLSVSLTVQAEEAWIDHKCYVTDAQGVEHVHFFQLQLSSKPEQMLALRGRGIRDRTGAVTARVDKISECVLSHQRFASAKAQALDELEPK